MSYVYWVSWALWEVEAEVSESILRDCQCQLEAFSWPGSTYSPLCLVVKVDIHKDCLPSCPSLSDKTHAKAEFSLISLANQQPA